MRVVLLCGGVGGARMARGLAAILPPERLAMVVNTGDDFRFWGLAICPDLDTVVYGLAGLIAEERGWGRAEETWHALEVVARLGGPSWFRLGDRDLGLHLERTRRLAGGDPLTRVTRELAGALGVRHPVLPMCDRPRPTRLRTPAGVLDFQEWLVRRGARDPVEEVLLPPPEPPAEAARAALEAADLVVLAPSNPYVSLDPILALAGVREILARRPVVAVSPLVGGRAFKGPLARMIPRLAGEPPGPAAIARHLAPLVDRWVVDPADLAGMPVPAEGADLRLDAAARREALARFVLETGAALLEEPP